MLNPLRIIQPDYQLLVPVLGALICGAIMVPSAAVTLGDSIWLKHWTYLLLGLLAFGTVVLLPTRLFALLHVPALMLALVLCALVLVPGLGLEDNGARRWLNLGFFTLQSAEHAKVLMLIYVAGFLARHGEQVAALRLELFEPIAALIVLSTLLLAAPDFGSMVVIGLVALGLLFVAGVRLRLFALLASVAVIGGAVVAVAAPYRVERLLAFIDPWSNAFGSAYQLTQSLIAFGRGSYFGVGLGSGVQKLHYLPESHNDFIFAVVVEELGLVGGLLLIALFAALILRLLSLGRQAVRQDFWFGAYLLYGVAFLLGGQFLINVGVSSGALPTKGLTLPLVSFGGNALLATGVLLGLACRAQYELHSDLLAPRQRRAAHRARRPRAPAAPVRRAAAKRTAAERRR
ncbi:MAG: FtsW/RodA/SpoVE family cell cycle protein [Pseudomonadota bacterium]